jgi:hypothetical protein
MGQCQVDQVLPSPVTLPPLLDVVGVDGLNNRFTHGLIIDLSQKNCTGNFPARGLRAGARFDSSSGWAEHAAMPINDQDFEADSIRAAVQVVAIAETGRLGVTAWLKRSDIQQRLDVVGGHAVAEPELVALVEDRIAGILGPRCLPSASEFDTCDLDTLNEVVQTAIDELPRALAEFDSRFWGFKDIPLHQRGSSADAAELALNYLTRNAGREMRGRDTQPRWESEL